MPSVPVDDGSEQVEASHAVVLPLDGAIADFTLPPDAQVLKPDTPEQARALFPGADVYALEAEWRSFWASSGRPELRSADAAFLEFVRKKAG